MQRNGQNPIRKERSQDQARGKFSNAGLNQAHSAGVTHCPACHAEVQPKPGFRMTSIKCPECGAAMGKK